MKIRLNVLVIAALASAVVGTLFIFHDQGDAAPRPSPAPVSPVVTEALRQPVSNSQPVMAASPAAIESVPAFSSAAERQQTLSQRQTALPVFLKAADESLASLRNDIELARAHGAPTADIAAKESKLQQLQQVRQQVLARNFDIQS